jgi:Flp pilus assembly pilin Flp
VIPLQLFGIDPLVELILAVVVSVVVIAVGTYLGVLVALQSFFGQSTWEEVTSSETQ